MIGCLQYGDHGRAGAAINSSVPHGLLVASYHRDFAIWRFRCA